MMSLTVTGPWQQMLHHPFFVPAAGAGVLLLLASFITLRLVSRARARRERAQLLAQIDELFRENRLAAEATTRLTRRLQDAEDLIKQLQARLETLQPPEPIIEADHAYAQAIRLVRRGADANRLVSDFGLTRAEADLLTHLHGPRKTG